MGITAALHRALQQTPDRPMTVFGDRVRTVAESADRIARFAGALQTLGVRTGDRVGILALNSDRYHEYLLAVPWAGAAVTPANVRWSPAEIAYSLQDSETQVLLVDDTFTPTVSALRAKYPGLTTLIYIGEGETPEGMLGYEQLLADTKPIEDARRGCGDLVGVYYTGGTTGAPKGVMLSHDNLLSSAMGSLATMDVLGRGGQLLHAAPMFHLADIAAWMMGMLSGATHVIIPMFTPAGVVNAVGAYDITDMLLVPTMIQMVADFPASADTDLSSVEHVMYGASVISQAVLERARKVLRVAKFTQAYGMTELSPVATLLSAEDHDDPELMRSAGRAGVHVEVRIVDPDDNEVPLGTVGEVVVRGDNVMLGYWNRPEETANALRGGWMHTGDGAHMDQRGYIYIVDRIKDMIVSGGENVYSAEVENALAKHPAVAMSAVIGVPDEQWGERVHAVVVLQPDQTANEEKLREFCREHIAGYKVPRSMEFVSELPMSGAGKILKRELREQHWEETERQVH